MDYLLRESIKRASKDNNYIIHDSMKNDLHTLLDTLLTENYALICNQNIEKSSDYFEKYLKACLNLLRNTSEESKQIISEHLYKISTIFPSDQSTICTSLISDSQSIQYKSMEYLLDQFYTPNFDISTEILPEPARMKTRRNLCSIQ